MSSAPPTVQSAQYCDEMQHNQTTTAPEAMPANQMEPAPAMPANQTAPMPFNTTTTGGPNTTTVVTSPEGRQQSQHTNAGRKGGMMGSKKLNLRHW